MTLIIGSEGSMGRRWSAVLAYLKEPFIGVDQVKNKPDEIEREIKKADRYILASPTVTHVEYLRKILPYKRPTLCEKPVTKDLEELIDFHAECARNGWAYNMVMQYKRLDVPLRTPDRWSFYDYFNPGKDEDGLAWNAMQTIALANGPVWVRAESPIWNVTINGRSLQLSDMDMAYVAEARLWLMNALDQSMDEILHIHKKVHAWKEINEPSN